MGFGGGGVGWAGWEERAVASFTTQSSEELASAMRKRRIFFFKSKLLSIGTLVDVWIDRD